VAPGTRQAIPTITAGSECREPKLSLMGGFVDEESSPASPCSYAEGGVGSDGGECESLLTDADDDIVVGISSLRIGKDLK